MKTRLYTVTDFPTDDSPLSYQAPTATKHPPNHPDVTGRYYVPGFPIGEGKTDYEKYLKTQTLLSLQTPKGLAVSPEEPLFQITHQAAELWMKMMLLELERIVEFMDTDQLLMACRSFRLVNDCLQILIAQVDLIARNISIVEYGKIRLALGQGSGMESPGFNWLLEMAPRLWTHFSALLQRRGIPLREIYVNYQQQIELHTLAEALMDYDDLFHKWRAHHVALVARTIGTESNSLKGLSTQVLQKGVKTRFFPELLELRSILTNESSLAYGGQPLEQAPA
jgi:tryptophan 2,3-dioxygenase